MNDADDLLGPARRAEFLAWVRDCGRDTDGAWSAWQAAYRAGMERAAVIAEQKAESIRLANTYRGKVNAPSGFAADMVDDTAAAIRAAK
jgi:hypothetical protein